MIGKEGTSGSFLSGPGLLEGRVRMTRESTSNQKVWRYGFAALCLLIGTYHVAANWYGLLQPLVHASLHLGTMMLLAFLITSDKAAGGLRHPVIGGLFALVAALSFFYTSLFHIEIQERGIFPDWADKIFAIVAILGVLEATRRFYGLPLPIIAVIVLIYAFLGDAMPEGWRHSSWDWDFLTYSIYMGSDGVFGVAAKTSAVLIFTFVMLGAFLEKIGATQRIIEIATNLTQPYSGGTAKVAILASGMMGTISGSSVANVTATGRFTIPLMIRNGFRPTFAAGVEAVASTGGLIMPPIMGAGAFIMAEILGESYWDIAIAALVPALLYYLVVFMAVHFEARRIGQTGGPREMPILTALRKGGPFLLPIVFLIVFISFDISPVRAALYTIVVTVALGAVLVRPFSPGLVVDALIHGTKEAVPIATACACAGIIIGALTGTGFVIKFSSTLLDLSGGLVPLALFLSMLVVIFLGMALPATASYLVGSAVVAVPLIKLGFPPLAVHLFIFYFANLAHITPPVDLATYAAAGIAKTNPLVTSFSALKLGLIAFVLPFIFISEPVLLLIDFEVWTFAKALGTALVGAVILGGGLTGWLVITLSRPQQLLLCSAGILLLIPDIRLAFVGGGIAGVFLIYAFVTGRRSNAV